jgi:hypothetical protein
MRRDVPARGPWGVTVAVIAERETGF